MLENFFPKGGLFFVQVPFSQAVSQVFPEGCVTRVRLSVT